MQFPKQIQNLIEALERLPGVGPKTAERLAFYLLHVPDTEIGKLAQSVSGLKEGIKLCTVCRNISSQDICEICSDSRRDQTVLMVVESPLDVFSFEETGKYHGVYHVLRGVINPLNNIGPEELYIKDLIDRLKHLKAGSKQMGAGKKQVTEVILALNPTMEGEATAMYLTKQLKMENGKWKITRMGVGIPIGGDLQYADETTLSRALEGRREYE